MNMIKLNKYT